MLNIILCGAPGSGKGTQSQFIVDKYQVSHLSTGDLLRAEIARKSELGNQVNDIISRGELVPDEIMLALIENYMDQLPKDAKGIIFDGFPRTVNQAKELDKLLAKKGEKAVVIDLFVEEEELVDRLLNRGKTSGRADDNLETIRKRLDVFHHQTQPVCAYYSEQGQYYAIDGMGTMQEIFGKIDRVLASF